MFSRDYLLRQLQQFIQAISLVLTHRNEGREDLAEQVIHNTMMDATGQSLEAVRQLPKEALVGLLSDGAKLQTDTAVAMADLLSEDQDVAGRLRALWLYEAVLRAGGAVPFDIQVRMAALRG